jgi:anthranilate phosphoribosyltransferase
MKHVAAVRKRLGIRTIFNILGPLANPAGARFQLLGAGRRELRPLLAGAMAKLGTARTLVVSGEDGLGDVTLSGVTNVTEVTPQGFREFTWRPEDFGVQRQSLDTLAIDSPTASAAVIRALLSGERGAPRDIVILNAAAGLIAAGKLDSPQSAAARAAEVIDSGAAAELLRRLAERSHQ